MYQSEVLSENLLIIFSKQLFGLIHVVLVQMIAIKKS